MSKIIGKVAATEKAPTTIDEFFFWTDKKRILHPFDVVKVEHIAKSDEKSFTFGVIEEISHITDATSYLTSYISNDFGDVDNTYNMNRIGMNFVKARVVCNTENIYTPVLDGHKVSLASEAEILEALGLNKVDKPLPCGFIEMYEGDDKVTLPVHFNSKFLIGPEGAHLNISGISGLAAKTSYAMFLLKAIQQKYLNKIDIDDNESIAFVYFNVKGRDLLAIDEKNIELTDEDIKIYERLGVNAEPFENVKYFYPYWNTNQPNSYADKTDVNNQSNQKKAFIYKYIYDKDKESLDMLFSNIEDSTGTMDSIINYLLNDPLEFKGIKCWEEFKDKVREHTEKQSGKDKDIAVASWRKFKRIISKALSNPLFSRGIVDNSNETRLKESINDIQKNNVFVIDIAKLSEDMQAFVFGDVIKAIYELKLGLNDDRADDDIPSKIVIFVDELNKYASTDVPKNSPILRQIQDITERGRSLGIILFSAEQFKSAIHDRVKGNCATHAYGRTNAIEISKPDYRFIPAVYKGMMTRLKQGEYIIQNPIFRSLLNIKFPKPLYKQFKNG